ncbi:serine/threonine protein phosphatase [Chelativorans sp. SCAU2101]|uniref:Serine/threonine protein phosphatase n=1 Tax=Chelativorans petroleitrophicus TaxID=2975484 RepID=A0A9X3B8Y8_9HYPH|nr:metallophosphoesterase family protein [Chelativorans petroleitrophicus]MCT8989601.1 serine/threonine protein phosphatase [Chelativorans petroleitrophicus]
MTYTTYAIGDVHGRADLLVPLLKAIGRKAEASGREPRVLFLGDIVDRGPFSRQAFDLVCDTLDRWPLSRLIRGNHDAYFLEFMTASEVDEDRFYRWLLRLGGYATIESYGLVSENSIADVAAVFRANFTRHLSALREAASIIVDERFAYVHAGISPSRPISDQDPKEIMTIRSGFLDYEGDLSHVIVHGHTVTASRRAELKSNRIALDTGAYATGRLTCLAVSSDEKNLEFLTAAQNASGIISGGVFSSTAVVERHTAG